MKPTHILAIALTTCFTSLAAQATPVTVDGTFTSFTSWIFDPSVRISYANGIPLTSSGTVVGDNGAIPFYASETINFTTPTTSLVFNYDLTTFPTALVNSFQLTPGGADVAPGQPFRLSTFTFTNGFWFPQAEVGFRLTTHSADLALDGKTFDGTLRLISVSTDDGSDPYAEADYVYVRELPSLGSMRVFDKFYQPPGDPGFSGDFAINGYIGSLVLTGLDSVNAAGFTNPSIEPQLVPEPSSISLLMVGLIAFVRRNGLTRSGL